MVESGALAKSSQVGASGSLWFAEGTTGGAEGDGPRVSCLGSALQRKVTVGGGACLDPELPPKSQLPPPAGSGPLAAPPHALCWPKGDPAAASRPAPRVGPRAYSLPRIFLRRAQAAVCVRLPMLLFCRDGPPKTTSRKELRPHSEAAWTRPPEFAVLNSLFKCPPLPCQESILIPRMGK